MPALSDEQIAELTADQIRQAASKLSLEDREDLTTELVRSIQAEREEIEKSWIELAQRRLEEIRAGRASTTPHDEVMRLVTADLDAIELERDQ